MMNKIGSLHFTKVMRFGLVIVGLALFVALFSRGISQANDTRAIVGERHVPDSEQSEVSSAASNEHTTIPSMSKVYIPPTLNQVENYPATTDTTESAPNKELPPANPSQKPDNSRPQPRPLNLELKNPIMRIKQ